MAWANDQVGGGFKINRWYAGQDTTGLLFPPLNTRELLSLSPLSFWSSTTEVFQFRGLANEFQSYHALFIVGSYAFTVGGMGTISGSPQPAVSFSAVTMNLARYAFSPICQSVENTAALVVFPSGTQQKTQLLPAACAVCAVGSYLNTSLGQCRMCVPGSFSGIAGLVNGCVLCPKGTANAIAGAQSARACSACAAGTYNTRLGASGCLPCPVGCVCPMLCSTPLCGVTNMSQANPIFRAQPIPYAGNAVEADAAFSTVLYTVLGMAAFVLVAASLLARYSERGSGLITSLDMIFAEQHHPWTRPILHPTDKWRSLFVRGWKNAFGGVTSLMWVFLLVIVAASLFLPFLLDNFVESRALVPSMTLDESTQSAFASTISLTLKLRNYGQSCRASNALETTCDPRIAVTLLTTVHGVATPQLFDITCTDYYDTTVVPATIDACIFSLTCSRCAFGSGGLLTAVFNQRFSFASAIDWAVNISTGYLGQNSTFRGGIVAPTNAQVFRGPTPSSFAFALTPTAYRAYDFRVPLSLGYHADLLATQLGSLVTAPEFVETQSVRVGLNFTIASNTFQIIQSIKIDLPRVFSALGGAVSGVTAVLGIVMTLLEQYFGDHPSKDLVEAQTDLIDALPADLDPVPSDKCSIRSESAVTDQNPGEQVDEVHLQVQAHQVELPLAPVQLDQVELTQVQAVHNAVVDDRKMRAQGAMARGVALMKRLREKQQVPSSAPAMSSALSNQFLRLHAPVPVIASEPVLVLTRNPLYPATAANAD
jgi:hypothetical protein